MQNIKWLFRDFKVRFLIKHFLSSAVQTVDPKCHMVYQNVFTGFHDRIIGCRGYVIAVERMHVAPQLDHKILLLENNRRVPVGVSNVFETQTGSYTIYNPLIDLFSYVTNESGTLLSSAVDFTGHTVRSFDVPIVCSSSSYAFSYDLRALNKQMPNYGANSGRCNFPASQVVLLNYEKMNYSAVDVPIDFNQFISHVHCSASGKYFLVNVREKGNSHVNQLYLYDSRSLSEIFVSEKGLYTHFSVADDGSFVAFGKTENGVGYHIFSGGRKRLIHCSDGHPCLFNGEDWISDEYHNTKGVAHLYKYSGSGKEILARFRRPSVFFEDFRIDLHPKTNVERSSIFLDHFADNSFQLMELKLT